MFLFFLMLLSIIASYVFSFEDPIAKCYVKYDENMCPTCISRGDAFCGYCISLNECMEGTLEGSSKGSVECQPQYWVANKTTCSNDFCLKSDSEHLCRAPCRWNDKYNQCILPRDMEIDSNKEKRQFQEIAISKRIYFSSICLLIVFFIITVIYSIWYSTKPSYEFLPDIENALNLDDLPPPITDVQSN